MENNKNTKILKKENLSYSNKKEDEMVLFPFSKKNTQKLVSIIAMIIGVLLMVSTPIIKLSNSLTLSGFVAGVIIALLGFVYFMDVQ